MKKFEFLLVLPFMIICMSTSMSQVHLNANAGGGLLKMEGSTDHYFPGYRFHAGLTLEGPIPIAEDFSWETGLETAFGRSKFYRMARGNHSGINGEVPLDKSQKLTHSFWFWDIPARIRYNAFGFMGLMAGVNLSFTLDRKIYIPDEDKTIESYWNKEMIATAEAGLFFPVTDRIRIDIKAYTGLDDRFYLSRSVDESGKRNYGAGYSDYGILLNLAYRLNR